MNNIASKISTLIRSSYGYCLKWLYDLRILNVPALHTNKEADVIVSLTSYGRRVASGVVCYSIYSILRQTLQPKQIILWLTTGEWDDMSLPDKVKRLKDYGIEIRYCENMRSYTKLIPTMLQYPNNTIITIDDDILYPRTLIEELNKTHAIYPQAIIASYMRKPNLNDGKFLPYVTWKLDKPSSPTKNSLPLGVGGCLYPPSSLKREMLDYYLAKSICPLADDLWFWAAGLAVGTQKYALKDKYESVSFDAIYQHFHSGSALQHANVKGHSGLTNDEQIQAALEYIHKQYNITII